MEVFYILTNCIGFVNNLLGVDSLGHSSIVIGACDVLWSQEKCHQYWPTERSARYQYFVVDPMAEYNMPQYILREFKVTDARVRFVCSRPPKLVRVFIIIMHINSGLLPGTHRTLQS